jgi:shikimate kinase
MKIGFIGMSGVGKTFWATKLASSGFVCHHCDDSIVSRLQKEVDIPMTNLYDIGKWMGMPYDKGFAEKEKLHIKVENEILLELAESVYNSPPDENIVIDTAGSAIYADKNTLNKLKKAVLLIYLSITPEVHTQMLEEYVQRPMPLIWNGIFFKLPDETNETALRNNYPKLIAYREKLYEEFSDIKIEYKIHRQTGLSVKDFLELIKTPPNKACT